MLKIGFSRIRTTVFFAGALCLFALLILTCFFLSGEELVWEGKINDEKVANFFTSAGFIVAIFSVVGLMLQIWKSEEDKRPLIYPKESLVDLKHLYYWMDRGDPPDVFGFCSQVSLANLLDNKLGIYSIELQNLGLGIAKDLKYKWIFDKNQLIEFWKHKVKMWGVDQEIEGELEDICNFLKNYSTDHAINGEILNIDLEQSTRIVFPMYYMLGFLGVSNPVPIYNVPPLPLLQLEISYSSIHDILYKQRFDIFVAVWNVDDADPERKCYFKAIPYAEGSFPHLFKKLGEAW